MRADYILDQEFRDQILDDTTTKYKDFENCNFYNCDFRKCTFQTVTFIDCNFFDCNFQETKIN